jgi:hypothetical protein
MPDSNGEIPLTGDPRVDAALMRIRGKFQDLEDAMLVQAHLEKRQSEAISRLTAWVEQHEETKREHEEWLKHIQAKLDALANIAMRREGGPETTI